jgi:hypothetical protein
MPFQKLNRGRIPELENLRTIQGSDCHCLDWPTFHTPVVSEIAGRYEIPGPPQIWRPRKFGRNSK